MKKHLLIIYMLLLIGVPSVGWGQSLPMAYNIPLNSHANKIRYNNPTGKHIMYSFPNAYENHFSITDISNMLEDVKISERYVINDFEIFEDNVIFCGRTFSGEGMIGWFHIDDLFMAGVPAKFDPTLDVLGIASLENIEVYRDDKKNIHIAGYGVGYSGTTTIYKGFEAVGSTLTNMKYRVETFQHTICDLTVTDNYVAYVGSILYAGIVLYMFPKNDLFGNPYMQTAFYQTSYFNPVVTGQYIKEPIDNINLKVEHVKGDTVATLTYKGEFNFPPLTSPDTTLFMVLRKYDLSYLASSSSVVMNSAYEMKFATKRFPSMRELIYDPSQYTYSILQRTINPVGDNTETVTQIDFQSGIPTMVPNYYWPDPAFYMYGFCLSGSPYYTVSGFELSTGLTYFWQDQYGSTPARCIFVCPLSFSSLAVVDEKMDKLPSKVTAWQPLIYINGVRNPKITKISYRVCEN